MNEGWETRLQSSLKDLHLPAFRQNCHRLSVLAEKEGNSFPEYLLNLCELELEERRERRIERRRRVSKLPSSKTLPAFDRSRLSPAVNRQLSTLVEGEFLNRAENALFFGRPGTGKTHLMCALGHELVVRDHSVLFGPCALLVQKLLKAKTELRLEKELKRLDRFEALMIDDLGYVQQSREEMEVLFTLLAHRYERKSVLLTSNLVFSDWERIFKDPITTAAAVDRLIHHSVILELNLASYRMEEAQRNLKQKGDDDSAIPV